MVITLIGSIIGFLSSIVPEVISLWRGRQEPSQELELLKQKLELEKQYNQQYQELANSQQGNGDKQMRLHLALEMFKSSVRPVVTYTIFALFIAIKLHALIFMQDPYMAWDEESKVLFSVVITFWFGQRTVEKLHMGTPYQRRHQHSGRHDID